MIRLYGLGIILRKVEIRAITFGDEESDPWQLRVQKRQLSDRRPQLGARTATVGEFFIFSAITN
jgi:hypothetical protein